MCQGPTVETRMCVRTGTYGELITYTERYSRRGDAWVALLLVEIKDCKT